jgi:PAS domain S-box-containing protein
MAENLDTALQLAAIVESSDDAIISKDLTGIVQSWNRSAERIFGFSADEMIGQSIRTIIPADRQDEEDRVLEAVRSGRRVEHFETERRRKDGSLIPVSLTVSPIRSASGVIIGASKIARDITERRHAEARAEKAARRETFLAHVTAALTRSLDYQQTLKTLANFAVPRIADYCAVDVLNEDGEVVRLAVAHADPAKAKTAQEVWARYDDPHVSYSPQAVVRTGVPSFIPDITDAMIVKTAHGDRERLRLIRSLGVVSYLCVPMIAHDRTLGALTLANAESRTRYAEDDLRLAEDFASRAALAIENAQAYQQLRTADRVKDEFLATLSHELRTPLNAVLGYARMLKSGVIPPEKTSQALDVIDRNAASLTRIVEDVLDVSRIVSGKARLEVQPLDIAGVVRDAVATVLPTAEAKGVRLLTVIAAQVGPMSGDPNRLQQVIWNVLSNAVKFTPRGGTVQVRLGTVDSQAEIVIADSGIGIPPEFLPHIFERFRQAESGTTRRHGGLGLGLAIARHLVEMHGGTIQAESEGEGQGSTFRIGLPLIVHPESPAEDQSARRTGQQAERSRTADLEGVRVMAVDDDSDALKLVRDILEAAGARVTMVNSASAALEKIATDPPQVLVADLGMPGMDGYELIKRVRRLADQRLRGIPAAALTAYARSGDRARSLRSGFEMHLAKPIDPAELIATVGALARRHS